MERYLHRFAAENDIPGLAARILNGNEVVGEHLIGADGDGSALTVRTPFLIGSVAKPMTATLVLRLVEDGQVGLDDLAGEHLDSVPRPGPTIRQLLTHTSGYTSADGMRVAERHDNEPGALRRAAADLRRTAEPGVFRYSSANYLVLGALIDELRPDGSFGTHLERELFAPLNMHDSAATSNKAVELPPGHRYWWGHPRSYDPGFDESGAPYGYVVSTLEDLTAYVRAQDSDPLLRGQRLGANHNAAIDAGAFGFGWRSTDREAGTVVHHAGATPGYFAHVLRIPEQRRTVILLANAFSQARSELFGSAAFDLAALSGNSETDMAAPDSLLVAMPWIMSGAALAGGSATLAAFGFPRRRGRRYIVAAGAAGIAAGLWFLFPGVLGYDWRVIRTWMPDAAAATMAAVISFGAAAVVWTILPAHGLRRAHIRMPAGIRRHRRH